jgi:hypothetical protein
VQQNQESCDDCFHGFGRYDGISRTLYVRERRMNEIVEGSSPDLVTAQLDTVLWERLEAMQFDPPGAVLTFSGRLARENNWSPEHATRVIGEYRRFLYLAARAGHPVTPSDTVDHAWHLHLRYTRHYWEVLCKEVLCFDLHHDPTLGGEAERNKFENWYVRTLESYSAAFGPAPEDIWPRPENRLDRRPDFANSDLEPNRPVRRSLLSRLAISFAVVMGATSRGSVRGDGAAGDEADDRDGRRSGVAAASRGEVRGNAGFVCSGVGGGGSGAGGATGGAAGGADGGGGAAGGGGGGAAGGVGGGCGGGGCGGGGGSGG